MKLTAVLLALVLLGHSALSQAFYLKMTENEAITRIKNDVGLNVHIFKSDVQDGKRSIGWDNGYSRCYLYFNENGTSNMDCIVPDSKENLNTLVAIFNKDDVKISDTHWKMYYEGIVYDINLVYVDAQKKYAFYIIPFDNL
jgi:hypothetical protein